MLGSSSRFVTAHDGLDRLGVLRSRCLEPERVLGRREDRLADEGVLDQVEHVRRVAPELGGSDRRQLGLELEPRGAAVAAIRGRVGAAEGAGDGLADRVVDEQPVVPELDERQRPQSLERVLRGTLGQHRVEQRERDAANDRRGIQRFAQWRVEHLEVELGQLIEHGLQCDVLELCFWPRAHCGRRELERQRVPARQPVDPLRVGGLEARSRQELLGLALGEIPERHAEHERAPARRGVPDRHRRLPPCDHETRVVAQRGCEAPADPAVEQA